MTYPYIYAALVLVCLVLPLVGLWPIVRTGSGNINNPLSITMRAPDKQGARQPHAAIFAQEIAEYWMRWLVALIAAAPLVWFSWGSAISPAVQVLGPFALCLWPKVFGRQFELIGHAVEVAYARRHHGIGADYLQTEAEGMQRYYPEFRDMTVPQIIAGMEARQGLAKVFLAVLAIPIARQARKAA